MSLAAMEILIDEFLDLLRVVLDIFAERLVIEVLQLGDDAVDHSRREHTMLLKHLALTIEALG